ncbi:hypothetical protein RvY_05630 [Ramazzottius varieornatus]|uniref:Kinetochore protein Spc24 n=1 Tax=Ramazzottius varieornatus TaxID=947166 RepID=A0A1D1V5H2_RAMVA|nr:hypothetical protein RvY_05630 [Ramazzottius varieornatus]
MAEMGAPATLATDTAGEKETDIYPKIVAAFCSLTRAVEGKSFDRDQQKSNLHELKLTYKEQSDKLKRLDETLTELQRAAEEEDAQDEARFAEITRDISEVEDGLEYWKSIYGTMWNVLRVSFRCGDPADPTKVTLGFFLGKKDVAKRTLFLTEDPSVENVDAAWTNLKEVHEEKLKRPFLERFDNNSSGPL